MARPKGLEGSIPLIFPPRQLNQLIQSGRYYRPDIPLNFRSTATDRMHIRTLPLAVRGAEGNFSYWESEFGQGMPKIWEENGRDEIHEDKMKQTRRTRRELCADDEKVAGQISLGGNPRTDHDSELHAKRWLPPRGKNPCRMIEFQLWSKDQGYSPDIANHSTYRASRTWFDVGVETPQVDFFDGKPITWHADLLDTTSERLQKRRTGLLFAEPEDPRNIHAGQIHHHHNVTRHYLDNVEEGSAEAMEADLRGQGWQSLDGELIRNLEAGQCITLWMRARPDGGVRWEMNIKKAKIDIFWAI
ncbi:hypothetical protein BJ138DRAFT_1195983 [Hygrophoropsis aurantiaca]|uniref:Uncharacterized protein n=1 Tax=Hygrophoropsis aurantiaca TaxID=72124 RepID=A0ACB8A9Q9_9AGAM|nr:hypothetical protein BJ138DRAFT_1195983 [Hygrophoropsis aurantiaca]